MTEVFLPFRLVASFADGSRLLFDGITEEAAQSAMEAAQARHGEITWYDGVTDANYDHGRYYATLPPTPEIYVIDITDPEEDLP